MSKLKIGEREQELSDYVFGKPQPQALPLEEGVIGAVLLNKDAYSDVEHILRHPEYFYSSKNQVIWSCIQDMKGKGFPVDLLTVTEHLKKMGKLDEIGGGYYLVEMTNRVGSSAHIEHHALIIRSKYMRRRMVGFGLQLTKDGYEDTVDDTELMEWAEKEMFAIANDRLTKPAFSMGEMMPSFLQQMEANSKKKDGLTGVPSGFAGIDRRTGGWQSPDLVIVAARPGMGKSTYSFQLVKNAAELGYPAAFFSLEMSRNQLINRLVAAESGISSSRLHRGLLADHEWQTVNPIIEKLSNLPIFIDDTPSLNVFEFRSKARRLVSQMGIKLIVIDYIQLMTVTSENRNSNREQEVSAISRTLKAVAKELDVPVIALSQLSRAVEARGGAKRPQLSDLRESGGIEQDADIVTFIYRPEYYQILEDETGQSLKGVAEIIFAKHRNGSLDTERLRFEDKFVRFSDIDAFNPDFIPHPDTKVESSIRTTPKKDDEDIPF